VIEVGRWSIKPRIDFGVDHLRMDRFNESGDGRFGLKVDDQSQSYFHVRPGIDIATEIEAGDGMLVRPRVSIGVTRFLGDSDLTVTGRFASAPDTVDGFTTATELDKTRLDLAAGVDVFTRNNLVIRAELFGSLSSNSHSYGGGLKLELPF